MQYKLLLELEMQFSTKQIHYLKVLSLYPQEQINLFTATQTCMNIHVHVSESLVLGYWCCMGLCRLAWQASQQEIQVA